MTDREMVKYLLTKFNQNMEIKENEVWISLTLSSSWLDFNFDENDNLNYIEEGF